MEPGDTDALGDALGIAQRYVDFADVLNDPNVDFVHINSPIPDHAPMSLEALKAGKHVMCEARMAMNLSDGKHMLAASRKHPKLVAQIVPAPHTLAFDKTIQGMIADGYIGNLIAVDARIAAARAFPDASAPVHWSNSGR